MDRSEKRDLIERIDQEFDNSAKGRLAKAVVEGLPEDEPEEREGKAGTGDSSGG